MTFVSFICFTMFLILIISLFKRNTDVLSPARIFVLVWSIAVGLADLKLSRFQIQWTTYSLLMLLLCLGSTLVGMFVVYVIHFNKSIPNIITIRKTYNFDNIDHIYLYNIIIFLFLCYLVSFIASSLIEGYIPFFTFAPDATRTKWTVFGFGLFIQVVPAIIYFIIIFFSIEKGQTLKKMIMRIVAIITIATYFLILQRFYLIYCILLSVVLYYYSTKKLSLKKILITGLLFVLVIWGISSIRTSRYVINIVHYVSEMKYSSRYAFFTEPYMYIVMNLENFANAVSKVNQFDYGYNTFDFILALTGLKHVLLEYNNINLFPNIITKSFNTYTMYFIYYKDFSVIGLFLFPFIFGILVSTCYFRMRINPSIITISLYGICLFVVIFSFFIPILHWLHFIFNLVTIVFVTKIISKSNGNVNTQML